MSDTSSPQDASPKRARVRKSAAKKPRAAPSQPTATPAESVQPAPNPPEQAADLQIRSIQLTAVDRRSMIATAAYFRAERRRFAPGHEMEDWIAAEAEVEALLSTQAGAQGQRDEGA